MMSTPSLPPLRTGVLAPVLFCLPALGWADGERIPLEGKAQPLAAQALYDTQAVQPGTTKPGRAAADWPTAAEAWLARMQAATRDGLVLKHPEALVEWLDAVSEPRFMTALATVVLDPATDPVALGQAIDPAAALNWSEFTDPALYLRWMAAGGDTGFYGALFYRLANPEKLRRWTDYPAASAGVVPDVTPFNHQPVGRWATAPLDWAVDCLHSRRRSWAERPGEWLQLPLPVGAAQARYRY